MRTAVFVLLSLAAAAAGWQAAADVKRQPAGEMVSISAGTFKMGSNQEQPVHSVTVPAFWLGKYEVTFDQWDACVEDGGCNGYRPDDQGWGRGARPVINVSWDDAQSFIGWLKHKTGKPYRLPTEAEWEYAARAGTVTRYSWGGRVVGNRANCDHECGDKYEYTAPVGSFPANPWGLYDMHGNVWEWTEDCWTGGSYKGAPEDGSAWMGGNCARRMVRGGSWNYGGFKLRSAFRSWDDRSDRDANIGFRLARDK